MKLAITVTVKAMDTQRWVWRTDLFQFNGTSSEDVPRMIRGVAAVVKSRVQEASTLRDRTAMRFISQVDEERRRAERGGRLTGTAHDRPGEPAEASYFKRMRLAMLGTPASFNTNSM
jgi:hypothetical protein